MGPPPYRATRARDLSGPGADKLKWLGVEGSNPHYQGQNLASYH
jgi:hypothetical protein